MYYFHKVNPNIGKTLLSDEMVIFKPSSCMRHVHHLEQLIDILVRNRNTGEVSLDVVRVVLNNISKTRKMP